MCVISLKITSRMKNSFIILWIILFAFFCNKLFPQNYWEKTNGPFGGIVSTIAFGSGVEIFVGTSGGIFHSGNNGNSWVSKSDGLTGNVKAILNSANYIFAGTDEGIFRSSDNGNTWLPVNNGLTVVKITSLAKNSCGVLFAGAYDFDTFNGGIYRSSNNGETWTAINNGISFPAILTLIVAPNNYIFAGLSISGGIYRSINNGDNWERVYSNINVQSFAINSSGNIFAAYFGGILRTTNNGNEWTKITNGLTTTFIYSLYINSNNEIFAGGSASQSNEVLFHSVNNGDTWTSINTLQVNLVNLLSFRGNNLFAGTDRGIFRSIDNGINWTKINNGISASNVSSLQINKKDGYIYAGYFGTGVFRSNDKGNTWEEKNNGLDLSVQCLAINDSGHIFAGTFDAGLFRSTDKGENWIQIYNPAYHVIYSIGINDSDYIYIEAFTAYGSLVLKSINNGLNWTLKNTGLSETDDVLAFAFNSSGNIFAGTSSSGVFRSTDYGETWVPLNGYFPPFAGRIEVSPNGNVFVSPYYSLSGIYRSTDNGGVWEGREVVSGTTIQALETNSDGELFAGTYEKGIYLSTNNGDSWSEINNGLTAKRVPALAFDSNGYIYAGTIGGGVFRSINSTTSVRKINEIIPPGFSLSQNYPNPFQSTTIIRYEIPQSGFVTLKVYDLPGREVATLVNEEKRPGEYEVQFNGHSGEGRNLPGGVYFYRLKVGEIAQTKKMTLIK